MHAIDDCIPLWACLYMNTVLGGDSYYKVLYYIYVKNLLVQDIVFIIVETDNNL